MQKKIIVILVLFFIQITLFSQSGQLGDVDENGVVHIIDALIIARYYVKLPVSTMNTYYADVNCSNTIDIVDALLVARYYVGLITQFPCTLEPTPTPVPTPVETMHPDIGRVFIYPVTQTIYSGDHFVTDLYIYSDLWYYQYVDFVIYYDYSIVRVNEAVGVHGIEEGFVALPVVDVEITDRYTDNFLNCLYFQL